jgi:hypothetical protein
LEATVVLVLQAVLVGQLSPTLEEAVAASTQPEPLEEQVELGVEEILVQFQAVMEMRELQIQAVVAVVLGVTLLATPLLAAQAVAVS